MSDLAETRSTHELIAFYLDCPVDPDDSTYRHLLSVLQHRVPTMFPQLQEMLRSSEPKLRAKAASLLAQNMVENKVLIRESHEELRRLLVERDETEAEVISHALNAVGTLTESGDVELLLRFVEHPESSVRLSCACALEGKTDDRAVPALIQLSADSDGDVRNWATFGLTLLHGSAIDTPEIRAAMVARVSDDCSDGCQGDPKGEALLGLVQYRDARVIPAILEELKKWDDRPRSQNLDMSYIGEAVEMLCELRSEFGQEWTPVFQKLDEMGLMTYRCELYALLPRRLNR